MTLGNKLSKLRKDNNYTQEQLASILGVSRQSISKWESDTAYPETEKLIKISDIFECSLDYLLKDDVEKKSHNNECDTLNFFKRSIRERKSDKTLWGMPLWHIGKNARGILAVGINAKGIISIGLKSRGIISFGLLSMGLISTGVLSLGLISIGMFVLGLIAAGCISIGIFAFGAISIGIISCGAIAIGDFSFGALSLGKYLSIGDNANGMIAIGDTHVAGSVFEKIGELTDIELSNVKNLLDANVPTYLSWAKDIVKIFI